MNRRIRHDLWRLHLLASEDRGDSVAFGRAQGESAPHEADIAKRFASSEIGVIEASPVVDFEQPSSARGRCAHTMKSHAALDFDQAKAVALRAIPSLTGRTAEEVVLLDGLEVCTRLGWVLFCNTRAFLEGGDARDALEGSGAVVVMHDGRTRLVSWAHEAEEAMAELARAASLE